MSGAGRTSRNILVTGANGFLGTLLCESLAERGYAVRRAVRAPDAPASDRVVVGELGPETAWEHALDDVELVVHLAARAHVMREAAVDPLTEFRRINVLATQALAQAAVHAGVRRFVFVSSIKVNGESTAERPFTEQDTPRPEDAYGVSKWEAEQALQSSAARSRMQTVILRPPLLYGPGVKGNFLRLMRAIDRGVPLPLAAVDNRRSLLYAGNLVDAIALCLEHPQAMGNTYLVADDEDVSTPDLIRSMAVALDKPARLFPFPPTMLKFAGAALGKRDAVSRLLGSLRVDSNKIRHELGWRPRFARASGLNETARWYYRGRK